MTIGELLKEYRKNQHKNQKEFTAGIVSQSYYSKVEKNIHRITADDLLQLLDQNSISIKDFFEKLKIDSYQEQLDKINQFFKELTQASYSDNAVNQFKKLRRKAENLDINSDLKDEALLITDGFIESYKDDPKTFDKELRKRLKEKIFLLPEYDIYKLTLYSNFSDLYDFESNKQIVNQIIKVITKKPVERQDEILFVIILNVVKQGIEENKYNEIYEFVDVATKIQVTPDLFLYRELLTFYEEIVGYYDDKREEHLRRCRLIIESFKLSGMEAFAKEVEQFLDEIINKVGEKS